MSLPLTIALLLLAAIVVLAIVGSMGGKKLKQKFTALGEVKGLSKSAVIEAVGPPTGIESKVAGMMILEWRSGHYRAVLGFQGETCIGALEQRAA